MTRELKRQKIAEAFGWKKVPENDPEISVYNKNLWYRGIEEPTDTPDCFNDMEASESFLRRIGKWTED